MEWCTVQFRLSKKQTDGASLRDHLLAIPERMRNDEVRELLAERETPTRLFYLFEAFIDLQRARRSGFAAPEPIGYDQLYYWQRTVGYPLRRWEVDVIYRIDAAWLKMVSDDAQKKQQRKEKARG